MHAFEGGDVQSAKRYRRNFVCARTREAGSTQQNSEKPPLDSNAARARVCIGQDCDYAALQNRRQEIQQRPRTPPCLRPATISGTAGRASREGVFTPFLSGRFPEFIGRPHLVRQASIPENRPPDRPELSSKTGKLTMFDLDLPWGSGVLIDLNLWRPFPALSMLAGRGKRRQEKRG
jgi:hypothetical protein